MNTIQLVNTSKTMEDKFYFLEVTNNELTHTVKVSEITLNNLIKEGYTINGYAVEGLNSKIMSAKEVYKEIALQCCVYDLESLDVIIFSDIEKHVFNSTIDVRVVTENGRTEFITFAQAGTLVKAKSKANKMVEALLRNSFSVSPTILIEEGV